VKQLLRRHGRNHRFVLEAGRLMPKGADPIIPQEGIPLGTGTGPRIVRGAIFNDANIIEGTGFTAEWNDEDMSSPSLNLITVRFDDPFDEPGPIVLLTANNDNPADVEGEYVVTLKTRDPDFIVVEGKELDGTPNMGGFDFIAIEAAA
jgi:hypothetical protein